ncbi:MAG: alpha-1,4-glucan--maltose-1-phosphate maltosyltransferase [Planctomycetaceae bacterium]|nr:alpha-1,4-glucan--maltose-1-phosphate maltosyltransferase [Planctomycetaceae bacterium]
MTLDRPPSRVIIEGVAPEVDGGRFPAKRTVGEKIVVEADIHTDGHDRIAGRLRFRAEGGQAWTDVPLQPLVNDRWRASFVATTIGFWEFMLEAWIDRFGSWRGDLAKKTDAGQDVTSELLEGAALVREAASRAQGDERDWLLRQAEAIARSDDAALRARAGLDPTLAEVVARYPDRESGVAYERPVRVRVDRERARYGAWYELFPRSAADGERHGTLEDIRRRLPYIASMGFDVLYLPPIHPIGRAFRKGRNNSLETGPEDPGSPWGIGSEAGGHKAIHPELGTFEDFDALLSAAAAQGIEVAMDVAFQCSPDHPYVREHPEWFRHRPDGTIKYAENPPKKYQDIYPLDFECADWRSLWNELLSVVTFWAERGVRIFRVDNPHTKPFRFWEWLIAEIQKRFPDAVFLAEAFTRPKVMRYLAKAGFTQSYTYFTWRNTKKQLIEYFTELTQSEMRNYFRPNLFVNTPDILPEYLQYGGPAAFQIRLVLAATLGATYGVYGPSYENHEARPVRPGSEEYLDSEKYQIRKWDWEAPNVFREFIARVNAVRRDNPALQTNDRLRFYESDNDRIVSYGKTTEDLSNIIITAVNTDPHHVQTGWLYVPLEELGMSENDSYQVHDLITDARFLWHGSRNYVHLDPRSTSAHILRLRKRVKSERDFDYYF